MFVDASAAVAILANEDDAGTHAQKFADAEILITSPMAIYETAVSLARSKALTITTALERIDELYQEGNVRVVPLTDEIGRIALRAFTDYGKGKHKAGLNMGDCFAYACAKVHSVPLLCKGDDFIHTDIRIA